MADLSGIEYPSSPVSRRATLDTLSSYVAVWAQNACTSCMLQESLDVNNERPSSPLSDAVQHVEAMAVTSDEEGGRDAAMDGANAEQLPEQAATTRLQGPQGQYQCVVKKMILNLVDGFMPHSAEECDVNQHVVSFSNAWIPADTGEHKLCKENFRTLAANKEFISWVGYIPNSSFHGTRALKPWAFLKFNTMQQTLDRFMKLMCPASKMYFPHLAPKAYATSYGGGGKPVWEHLASAFIQYAGHAFVRFEPPATHVYEPRKNPDLIYLVWWHFATVLNCMFVGKQRVPIFYFNFFQIDVPGAEYMICNWYMCFRKNSSYKYMVHFVLRGRVQLKGAGFDVVDLVKGEVVVHPIKYHMRLIPSHARNSADVLTMII